MFGFDSKLKGYVSTSGTATEARNKLGCKL